MLPLVSIVVVTWNGLHHLRQSVPAILDQHLPHNQRFELVVVDNASVDGTAEYLNDAAARDPRAVAGSWHQPKDYAYAMSSSMSTAYWCGFNLAAEALTRRHPKRSLTVRYEEFIADPVATLAAILRLCGAESSVIPLQGRVIELGVNHTVTGNPDRFRSGATVIRDADDSWKASLPTSAKLAAAALSWPLFWRYGYRYAQVRRPSGPRA